MKIFTNWFYLSFFLVLAIGCHGGGGGGNNNGGNGAGNGWTLRGPNGGAMNFFVVNPASRDGRVLNEYFVAGSGGVFYTADSGAHFSERTNGLPSGQIQGLVGDFATPSILYVAVSDPNVGHGIYYSEDGGVSWTQTTGIAFTAADQYEIVLKHTNIPTRRVYAAVYNVSNPSTKLYFIDNNPALAWTEIAITGGIARIRDIDISTRNASQVYVAHSAGVGYFNGNTWSNATLGNKYSLAVRYGGDNAGSQDDFIVGDLTGIYVSLDGVAGGSDVVTGTNIDNQQVNSIILENNNDPTNINNAVEAYIASPDSGNNSVGAIHITDVFSKLGAPTYTRVDEGLVGTSPPGASGLAVGFNFNGANDVIHRGSFYEGVQFRDTDGANFTTFNNGMIATSINDLLINQNSASGAEVLAATNSGLFYSADSGVTWTRANNSIENAGVLQPGLDMFIATIDIAFNAFFVGIGTTVYNYDRGAGTFTQSRTFAGPVTAMASAPNSNDIFVATNGDGLWRNTLGVWTQISIAPANLASVSSTIDGLVVYTGGSNSGVYKGTRAGAFVQLNGGVIPTTTTPQALACNIANGNEVYAGFGTQGVFFSSNQGTNWSARNTGLSTQAQKVYGIAISANSSQVYIASEAGVYYSLDSGLLWQSRNNGLSLRKQKIRALDIFLNNNAIIYAGSDNYGVFHSTNGGQ